MIGQPQATVADTSASMRRVYGVHRCDSLAARRARGEEPMEIWSDRSKPDNEADRDCPGVTSGFTSAAESSGDGGIVKGHYDAIARSFQRTQAPEATFRIRYERAGGLSRCSVVPKGKTCMIGLITNQSREDRGPSTRCGAASTNGRVILPLAPQWHQPQAASLRVCAVIY